MKFTARLLIAATLVFGSGCAKTDWIDRTLVTVDVTGTWYGRAESTGTGSSPPDLLFELEQQGSTVKGFLRLPAGGSSLATAGYSRLSPGPLEGTVAGDVFRFRQRDGNLEGELTINGDMMSGRMSFGGSYPISFQRVNPSPPRPRRPDDEMSTVARVLLATGLVPAALAAPKQTGSTGRW